MKKAIEFIEKNISINPLIKQIKVYGWQNEYDHLLIGSVCKYLFETFDVIENITPLTNENRPGNIKPKYYITVHDTGDADKNHNALFWSNTVKNEYWELGKYACSYQYVVGNDGTYHQIPDNEVAWHAGDTTKYDYALYDTGLSGSNNHPIITISTDGYYEIDNQKTNILAPRIFKEKDGQVLVDRTPCTNDLNDQSILCKLIDGKYYIGETYFNTTYNLIANRGGNNNSIGIESCVNEDTDIYYTWQKTAKLVANLLYNNNLTLDDVKQHHYYSGKDCPQTMRKNNLWNHFMSLVECELEAIVLLKEGYKFELISDENIIDKTGRVKKQIDTKIQVKITYKNNTEYLDFDIKFNTNGE